MRRHEAHTHNAVCCTVSTAPQREFTRNVVCMFLYKAARNGPAALDTTNGEAKKMPRSFIARAVLWVKSAPTGIERFLCPCSIRFNWSHVTRKQLSIFLSVQHFECISSTKYWTIARTHTHTHKPLQLWYIQNSTDKYLLMWCWCAALCFFSFCCYCCYRVIVCWCECAQRELYTLTYILWRCYYLFIGSRLHSSCDWKSRCKKNQIDFWMESVCADLMRRYLLTFKFGAIFFVVVRASSVQPLTLDCHFDFWALVWFMLC